MSEIFDYDLIKNCIIILSENHSLYIKDLEDYPEVLDCYEYINMFITITDKDQSYVKLYDKMIRLILKQYRPDNIYPDTIGSFLFGCFQKNYGDVDGFCSPLCSNSIQKSCYDSGISCKNQIWIQLPHAEIITIESRFAKLGSKCKAKTAYIYVDKTFDGFTLSELNYFKRFGVEKAQVMVTDNLKHHTIYNMNDITTLPLVSNYDGVITSYTLSVNSDVDLENTGTDSNWIFFTVIMVFMIIALIYVYLQ